MQNRPGMAVILSKADRMLGHGYRLAGCVAGIGQAVYAEARRLRRKFDHGPPRKQQGSGSVTVRYSLLPFWSPSFVASAETRQRQDEHPATMNQGTNKALPQHVEHEGQQLSHEMHASMQQTINQLSADLTAALARNGTLEAQVASLTAALGQPGRSCSGDVPSGPAPDAEPAQQAVPLSLSADPSMTSLPGAASFPSLTLQIAALPSFAEGSPLSPSSSPFGFSFASSLPAHISSASCVPLSPGASVDVQHEAPLSSAVHIPEVVQLQAPAHPSSSSPAAAPEDVPAAACCMGSASAEGSPALHQPPSVFQDERDHKGNQPAAAQPSTSPNEGESARAGPHYTAARRAHAPLLLLASAQTVPGYKGAHSSSGSAKPAAKGLLRRLRSPGAALPAVFATPKKVAGCLKTGLRGLAYGVAKKALPSALFSQPQAERLVAGRPASEALAAEAEALSGAERRLHTRAWEKLEEARVARDDVECAFKLLDEGIRLRAPGNVVNCRLYNNRASCQWERTCGVHAVLDATTAWQYNCPGGWQPLFMRGIAWKLMGIYSSALEDLSLAQQRGCNIQPGLLEQLAQQEDCVDHHHVLGFKFGTEHTVDSLSRRLLARLHPDKANNQSVPEALRERLYRMVQEAKDAL